MVESLPPVSGGSRCKEGEGYSSELTRVLFLIRVVRQEFLSIHRKALVTSLLMWSCFLS